MNRYTNASVPTLYRRISVGDLLEGCCFAHIWAAYVFVSGGVSRATPDAVPVTAVFKPSVETVRCS